MIQDYNDAYFLNRRLPSAGGVDEVIVGHLTGRYQFVRLRHREEQPVWSALFVGRPTPWSVRCRRTKASLLGIRFSARLLRSARADAADVVVYTRYYPTALGGMHLVVRP